jgi:hypothetical protein
MTNKDKVKEFKDRADSFNKGLYSDLLSFKNGLILVLIIASIVILFTFLK